MKEIPFAGGGKSTTWGVGIPFSGGHLLQVRGRGVPFAGGNLLQVRGKWELTRLGVPSSGGWRRGLWEYILQVGTFFR